MTTDATCTILNQIDSFPALPGTVTRVMAITADPESSAHDLMRALLPDPSMCVTILKIANSAFFCMPRQVGTIEKAVMVLGFDEIRNIVLGKAVFNSFRELNRTNRQLIDRFWEHSFICGLAAKIIAEEVQRSPSELFIAGLIHDIGKLAMLMCLNSDYATVLDLSSPLEFRSYLKEKAHFSISHDDVGLRLVKRWLFPESLICAVGYHHRPQESPADPVPPIIVQIADTLSLLHCNPKGAGGRDIMAIIEDFLPEIKTLWEKQGLAWTIDDLLRWQEQLTLSSTRDGAVLSILTT